MFGIRNKNNRTEGPSGLHIVVTFLAGLIICLTSTGIAFAEEPELSSDYSRLKGHNWMSGISGDRKLNEIVMPGSHDSGTKNVKNDGALSIVGFAVNDLAKTQDMYIPAQLNAGARVLDLRFGKLDGRSKIVLCHGEKNVKLSITTVNLCFVGRDDKDKEITFDVAMGYIRQFLKDHPTETVMVNLQVETGDSSEVISQMKTGLSGMNVENPSTGKPYLYTQSGGQYSFIPSLKDVRGQMVVISKHSGDLGCGFQFSPGNKTGSTSVAGMDFYYENSWDKKSGDKRTLVESYVKNGTYVRSLPRGVDSHLASGSVLFTSSNALLDDNPKDVSNKVNPWIRSYADANRGKNFGWIFSDFVTEEYMKSLWSTNYPDDLAYCKVEYDLRGGTVDGRTAVDPVLVLRGSTAIVRGTPEKGEQKFTGWYQDRSCTRGWDHAKDTVTQDIILYAGWTELFGVPVYEWAANGRWCIAKRISATDPSLTEQELSYAEIKETKATCTQDGEKVYTARFNNTSFRTQRRREVIPATGHDYGNWVYVNDSLHKRVCKNDNYHEETGEHSWDEGVVIKAATKDEAGVRTFTCEGCGGTKTLASPWTGGDENPSPADSQADSGAVPIPPATVNKVPKVTKISKKANPLRVKGKTAVVKFSKLKKKAQTISRVRALTVTRPQGRMTYNKVSVTYTKAKSVKMSKKALKKYKKQAAKKITIKAGTGKITLKKGLKKGTYKVKVKVKAAGNKKYKSVTKTTTFKVKVR